MSSSSVSTQETWSASSETSSSVDIWRSTSSLTETFSSNSSSSSGDVIREGKSSLVFLDPVMSLHFAVYAAIVDLDAIDLHKVRATRRHYIDMAGTYAGIVVPRTVVPLVDGTRLSLKISPRYSSSQEEAMVKTWQQAMLSRVRAELAAIREEYDAQLNPGDPIQGNQI